jgi:hypothetical protein
MSEEPTVGLPSIDRDYDTLLARIQERCLANVESGGALFTTDATGLFQSYLDALPAADRQSHHCDACRRFLEAFGGLVTIDTKGVTRPAVWHGLNAPDYYARAVAALDRVVRRARVTGVFLSSLEVWGKPVTGEWRHLAVKPSPSAVFESRLLTARQAMSEKAEDFRSVSRALSAYADGILGQALRLLETEVLYRSEKVAGPARWLRELQISRDAVRGEGRDHVVWRAAATAPAGFCHPRSSMIGTLLEDLATGMDFATVSARFAAKMHPLKYQRPQAAPRAGNIADAEKIVAQLGIARSLERRFARIDEIQTLWTHPPAPELLDRVGVFSHLPARGDTAPTPLDVPPITMTWVKFAATILPTLESLELWVGEGADQYVALVTAVHADAPPILQWDRVDHRNPVSWYVYVNGSLPASWGLTPGRYHRVSAVALKPNLWGPTPLFHQGKGVVLVIDGARDSQNASLAIFPETLRSDLRAVRATVEAFSKAGKLVGAEEASANGLLLSKGLTWNAQLRVTSSGSQQRYRLDRWD